MCNSLNEQNKYGVIAQEEMPWFRRKRRMTTEFGTGLWHVMRNY